MAGLWRPEDRERRVKVPDGRFLLSVAGRPIRVAIEVEIAQKSAVRYEEVVQRLRFSDACDAIFFFSDSPKVGVKLRSTLAALRRDRLRVGAKASENGFYFVDLRTFLNQELEAVLSGDGDEFSLKSLESETTSS